MQLLFLQRDHYCLCSITQLLLIIKGLSLICGKHIQRDPKAPLCNFPPTSKCSSQPEKKK